MDTNKGEIILYFILFGGGTTMPTMFNGLFGSGGWTWGFYMKNMSSYAVSHFGGNIIFLKIYVIT